MLRDRDPAVDLFALVPALTLAFEPVLARLDQLLDDDALLQAVKQDLARRRPHTLETGRPSSPVEVLPRLLTGDRGGSTATVRRQVEAAGVTRSPCPTPARRRRPVGSGSASIGSGRTTAGGRGSKAGSASSSGSTGSTAARTMARRGWSAGSGWGF